MLRQDQGLLLGQGHQPFGVSQLWVLGMGVALVAGCFAAGLSAHLRGFPTRRALRLGWLCGTTILFFTNLIQNILGCHKDPRGAATKDRLAWPH